MGRLHRSMFAGIRLERDGVQAADRGWEPLARGSRPTRALLIDDHPLFRRGARDLMEASGAFRVIGEAGSGGEGVGLALELRPDLVLLDLRLPDMDGPAALRRMREAGNSSRVAVITVSRQPDDLTAALRAGADGYLLKNAEPATLLSQLRRIVAGQIVLGDGLGESLAVAIRADRRCEALDRAGLTGREREILERIALGLSNKEIARDLGIADATVKVHVKHLLKKLNLHSRVEAALWCINQGRRGGSGARLPERGVQRLQAEMPPHGRMPEHEGGREG